MRPLTTTELLAVWEAGEQQSLLEKSLHLLRLAYSAADLNSVATLSIGERDACLLLLRERLFGRRLVNKATCPTCTETVEWETNTCDLHLQAPIAAEQPREFVLEEEGFTIRFRLPNSHDLRRAMMQAGDQFKPQQLLAACLLHIRRNAQEYAFEALPPSLIEALNERMAQEDPQANIQMLVGCPGCGAQWEVRFDIVSYLWLEIDNWAHHVLQQVYVLAKAFGWSENDILRLSPQRRQLYLTMLQA